MTYVKFHDPGRKASARYGRRYFEPRPRARIDFLTAVVDDEPCIWPYRSVILFEIGNESAILKARGSHVHVKWNLETLHTLIPAVARGVLL
jgi:hypothetical protein